MSCPIKQKLIEDLVDKGAINEDRHVINFNKFDGLNELYSNIAEQKYGLNTYGKSLFDIDAETSIIIPNDNVLSLYDDIVKEYEKEHIITKQDDIIIKEGVDTIFENNSELSEIGTQEDYSKYLDTIFPNSKVKDIVYRAGAMNPSEFTEDITDYMDLGSGYYASPNKEFASEYGTPKAIVVNITTPKDRYIAEVERGDEKYMGFIPELSDDGKFDSIIDLSKAFKDTYELVIFKPEQMHILGSEQDIEGFREYSNNISNKSLQVEKPRLEDLLDEKADDFLYIIEEDSTKDTSKEENVNSQILFGNEEGSFTANEVLDNIKNNYKGLNKFTQFLIDKLIPLLYKTNAKIKFVNESQLKTFNTVMQYDPLSNTILISKDRLLAFDTKTVIASFLHEVVHSVTLKAFTRPETMSEKIFQDFINEMFTKYQGLSQSSAYGFKNQMEFIAELMSNEDFQAEMMAIEEGNTNLWKQFVDFVRTLIGLPRNTDYNKLVDAITKTIQESDYEGGINMPIFESREPRTYYSLSSIEERQTKLLNSIKDNLEESIRRYDVLIKKIKDPIKLTKYSDKLKSLFNEVDEFDDAKKWNAISIFSNNLAKNIKTLDENFNKEDLNAANIKETVHLYEKYLTSHSLIKEILEFIAEMKASKQTTISKEDIRTLEKELALAKGQYDSLYNSITAMNKRGMADVLNDRKYAGKVLAKWKTKLEKQYDILQLSENKTRWVARAMNTTYAKEIDADVEKFANGIVNDTHFDISWATYMFVSGISTNSKLVQIMQGLINTVRDNIIKRVRESDFKLDNVFNKWIKDKGNLSPSKAFKNLLEFDNNGKGYLKGDIKLEFKLTYEKLLAEYKDERDEIKEQYGQNSPKFVNFFRDSAFKKWVEDNTYQSKNEKGTLINLPNEKWLNKETDFTPIEWETLTLFRKISEDTKSQTFSMKSIITKSLFGSVFYNLPSITKSDLERVIEGKVIGIGVDAWKDLTSIRPDDIGYEQSKTDLANKPMYDVKINFRGKIDPKDQSLDLFTVYRLEARNGINFQEKHNAETNITTLVEVSKNKKYYKTTGNRIPFVNIMLKRTGTIETEGIESNTYKKMVSLMESNLYDILHKDAGKLGKLDINKAVGVLNGWTVRLGLWINEVSAGVNVLNGKAQLFLEIIAGNHIKSASLAKAEKSYFADALDNLKDMSSPIKHSRTNQINEFYDTFGLVSTRVEQAFIKNTLVKSIINQDSMQFMQNSSEHWLQSTLTQSVLDSIKVMDANNNFIDREGNVVEEKDAATLLDMLIKVDGKLTVSDKVVYTTRTLGIKYNEGGHQVITNFVKAKIFQILGNYDPNMQPEAMRHAKFKMLMTFRRFLVEMGLNRFRGIEHSNKSKDELFEEEEFFSDALQEDIEGMYTTTMRYFITAVLPSLKTMNFKLLSTNWNQLSIIEKKNIHKTIAEAGLNVFLFQLTMLLAGLAGDDDDDDSALWYIALITARLNSELMSYIDPTQQYKILKSPIPSMRVVQSLTNLVGTALTPWSINDRDNKGNLFIVKDAINLTPIMNLHKTTYKQKFQYIDYVTN